MLCEYKLADPAERLFLAQDTAPQRHLFAFDVQSFKVLTDQIAICLRLYWGGFFVSLFVHEGTEFPDTSKNLAIIIYASQKSTANAEFTVPRSLLCVTVLNLNTLEMLVDFVLVLFIY